jgi:outer membrane protein TolC
VLKRSRWTWASALVLVFIVNGCAVNQESDIQLYRDVLDAGKSEASDRFHPEDPLTLMDALRLANAQNEQLAMAGEDYLQTLIDKDRAFAAFLPKISLTPTFMFQGKTALAPDNPLIAEFEPVQATDLPATGNFDLHPFRDVPALQAAGNYAEMHRALLLDRQAILMLDVSRIYFQVMHSEKQVAVLRHSIDVARLRLKDILVKQQAGVARPVDVALTEAQLAKTQSRLIQAENDVKNGRAMLAFLIGVPEVKGPLTDGLIVPTTDWRIEPLQKLADANRQDLIAEHERVNVATAALEAAWGKYFPSVSLNLTYYLSRQTFPDDVDWSSLIQVNVPIFSAGLIHADVRAAYSRLRQARLAESYAQRQILKDLRTVVENLRNDDQQIDQLGIQAAAAQEGLRQADAAFNAGLGTNLERLVAQDALLSAELDLSTAQFNRNIDYLRLHRVTGALNPDLSVALPSSEINSQETIK